MFVSLYILTLVQIFHSDNFIFGVLGENILYFHNPHHAFRQIQAVNIYIKIDLDISSNNSHFYTKYYVIFSFKIIFALFNLVFSFHTYMYILLFIYIFSRQHTYYIILIHILQLYLQILIFSFPLLINLSLDGNHIYGF